MTSERQELEIVRPLNEGERERGLVVELKTSDGSTFPLHRVPFRDEQTAALAAALIANRYFL